MRAGGPCIRRVTRTGSWQLPENRQLLLSLTLNSDDRPSPHQGFSDSSSSKLPISKPSIPCDTLSMKVEKEPAAAKALKIELDALTNQISDALTALIQIEERKLLHSDGGPPTKAGNPSNLVH
jgi:hypothetical protein